MFLSKPQFLYIVFAEVVKESFINCYFYELLHLGFLKICYILLDQQ